MLITRDAGRLLSFNGAGLIRVRKQDTSPSSVSFAAYASMEPDSFESGNLIPPLSSASDQLASMEPDSFESGNIHGHP